MEHRSLKFFKISKDGGSESTVWGLFLIEIKSLFSVALLCFEDGSRDAYHSHAFDCVSWVLRGRLVERVMPEHMRGQWLQVHDPSFVPVITRRNRMHKVVSVGRTWVLTFRGPWAKTWREWLPAENRFVTLTHGRREIAG